MKRNRIKIAAITLIALAMVNCTQKETVEKGPDWGPKLAAMQAQIDLNYQNDALLEVRVAILEAKTDDDENKIQVLIDFQNSTGLVLADIDSQLSALSAEISSLINRLGADEDKMQTMAVQITNLSASLSSLTSQLNSVVISLSQDETSLANALNQIAVLAAQETATATALGALQAQVSAMQGSIPVIVNTCGSEKLMRFGSKLYGVMSNIKTQSYDLSKLTGSSVLNILQCNGGLGVNLGVQVCLGGMTVNAQPVNQMTNQTVAMVTGASVYWSEIPNSTYVTTDNSGNSNGVGCQFIVSNGQVSF